MQPLLCFDDELPNGPVFGRQALGAARRLNVAAALFGTTTVPAFLGHVGSEDPRALFSYSLLISSRFLPSAYFGFSLLFLVS